MQFSDAGVFKETPVFKCILYLLFISAAAPAFATLPAPVIETINGRQVESIILHHPTSREVVVFENGSRNAMDKWGSVPEQIAADASVFMYNRPGYGNSQIATTPRDGKTIVDELRALLHLKGFKPPYILVGHSLGGLYMQLFAKAYPDEVKSLVLIDSLYPGMIKKTEDFPLLTRLSGQLIFSRSVWKEIENIDLTGNNILNLPDINDKPIIRLRNQPLSATAIAVDFGAFRTDKETLDGIRGLYPKAKNIVADSSHQMALTSPGLVTAAIRQMLP